MRSVIKGGKVHLKWSNNFAYAIGLIATDGNLSPSGRHINFTSKNMEQTENFLVALDIVCHIKKKARIANDEKKYFVVQFGDVQFYKFLEKIGIHPAKSKNISKIKIPHKYFFDFLRGTYDGDGYSYSYWDRRWKSSFMFYVGFVSASKNHLSWLQNKLRDILGIKGHVTRTGSKICYQLKYAKKEGQLLLKKMYYSPNVLCLSRKRLKNNKILAIVGKSI